MPTPYDIHPDFNVPFAMDAGPFYVRFGGLLPRLASWFVPRAGGLRCRSERFTSFDGASLPLEIADPPAAGPRTPCILYFHGGAFIMSGTRLQQNMVHRLAAELPCRVISVDYRLAGQHPFPTGVEDCYAALLWTAQNAGRLGIDPQKIAVYGESAGGALAAAVAQMTRDRQGPPICYQMLVYPVTDCSQSSASARAYTDTPVWRSASNARMWQVYLRGSRGPCSPYASPLSAASLKGLPPAYVETAEFDPLHDEGIAYAQRLQAEGVETTLFETRRTVHGFDVIRSNEIVQASMNQRSAALKAHLG